MKLGYEHKTIVAQALFVLGLVAAFAGGMAYGQMIMAPLQDSITEAKETIRTLMAETQVLSERIAALEAEFQALGSRLDTLLPVAQRISRWNPGLGPEALGVAAVVVDAAATYGVPVDLVIALGAAESDWRLNARGRAGERGPLQVLPDTFRLLGGTDLSDWRQTLRAGVRYLSMTLERARGDVELAVALYNSGINRQPAVALRVSARHVRRVLVNMEG